MAPRVAALMLARGGSKGIPGKNIKAFLGQPLAVWALRACQDAADEVWLSTDSPEIEAAVMQHLPWVRVFRRGADAASDGASSVAAMLEFLQSGCTTAEIVLLVQATSPLLLPEHTHAALAPIRDGTADSTFGACRSHALRWERDAETGAWAAANFDPRRRPRRQDWDGDLVECGAFYATRVAALLETGVLQSGRCVPIELPPELAAEIDVPSDWPVVESLARRQQQQAAAAAGPVPAQLPRLVAFDVDGVLTDGAVFVSETGEALKAFYVRDGAGIARLRRAGVEVGLITGESTGFVTARASKLGIPPERVALGASARKLAVLTEWKDAAGLAWSDVGYMGDDAMDAECLAVAGWSAAPSDADPAAKAAACWVAAAPGGRGAVREWVNYMFDSTAGAAAGAGEA